MKTILIFTGCMITAFAGPLRAQQPLLPDFFSGGRAASAEFTQKDRQGSSSGTLTLAPGGSFRWEQMSPYKMLIVSNNRQAWQIDYDLNQATRLDPRQSSGWSFFFSDSKALERTHMTEKNGDTIVLTPVDPGKHTPARLKLDAQGNPTWLAIEGSERVEITFRNWTKDKPSQSDFEYLPDTNMDVVGVSP